MAQIVITSRHEVNGMIHQIPQWGHSQYYMGTTHSAKCQNAKLERSKRAECRTDLGLGCCCCCFLLSVQSELDIVAEHHAE